MKKSKFYGREYELRQLEQFLEKDSASMLVIKGRWHIGKSRLIKEFI